MVDDVDVWRSAHMLIKKHGAMAEIEAAMRADQLLDEGDVEGAAVWKRISRVIGELQARTLQ